MEVFEEKPRVKRHSSSASVRMRRNSKVKYILSMAGIILFTSAVLIIIHFTREYSFWSTENSYLQSKDAEMERVEGRVCEKPYCDSETEKFERRICDVPFCNTKECVFIASALLESMNLDADPCSDFYEYACGGYSSTNAVPYASDYYSPIREAQEELLIDIRKMMEKPLQNNEKASSAVTKMKRIYSSCMNVSRRDEIENRTLSLWLSDLKFVPPNYAFGSRFDFEPLVHWTELVTNLEQYQIHTLFKPHFVTAENSAPERLEVDCLVPFLNPEAYLNTTDDELAFQLVMYKESMNAALELLHVDRATRRQFVEDVIKLDTNIARAVSNAGPSSYPYLREEHKQVLKGIWQSVVGNAVETMEVVSTCKYDMETILTVLSQASNKNVSRYIMWRALMQIMQHLGTEFNSLHLHYMTKLPGFDYAYESKWKECVDVVRLDLGLVAMKSLFDSGFIDKELINAVKAEFLEMKRDLALNFSPLLEKVDQTFAKKFLDKLQRMKLNTGYVENLTDGKVLDTVYQDMDVGDDYFSNILNMKRFKARREFLRLWNQIDEDATKEISLEDTPLGTSSSYDYLTNAVRVDLGLLRAPVFVHSQEIPEFLTYGFSNILAREIARAFDVTGSHYDADGQYFEKIFWPSTIEQKYEDFLSCLGDQLIRVKANEHVNINDTRVLNNVVADMGSVFVPYEGLKAHLKSHMGEKPLPGVPLNKKQTFFVQTAQIFCEIRSKPASDIKSRYLLPPKLRTNIAFSNMEEFEDVFNCPAQSSMNLDNKCNLFSLLPDDQ